MSNLRADTVWKWYRTSLKELHRHRPMILRSRHRLKSLKTMQIMLLYRWSALAVQKLM